MVFHEHFLLQCSPAGQVPATLVPELTVFRFSSGYDHRVANPALPGEFYGEVKYRCLEGRSMVTEAADKLYCSEGEWIGRRPECVTSTDGKRGAAPCSDKQAAECDHACSLK